MSPQDENRTRPRSALKVTQSDDFWLKLKSDEKVEEEKLKVLKEIESIKQARLKFEDEPEERYDDRALFYVVCIPLKITPIV